VLGVHAQVLDTCLAAGIPVAGNVGGGYCPDLTVLARRHCILHQAASMMWESYELGRGGLERSEALQS
jgi:hypothetical protein